MLAVSAAAAAFPMVAHAERVEALADFAGIRENQLIGYGLVIGLDNTGDQTTQTPFTAQSLNNMLSQLGITVPPGTNMQLRNVAAVMVTAKMAPFSRPGQYVDVVVSSIGNAKSLRGGTLLMTPLKGADGQVYALAQGNLVGAGPSAEANGSSVAINQQGGARIPRGAIVEREIPTQIASAGNQLDLYLRQPDFNTARRMVFAINSAFGRTVASAHDAGLIRLDGPASPNERVNFIARINMVDLEPGKALPKVVFNSRTGAVVLNEGVRLHKAAVAHGNLSIVIESDNEVAQPNALAGGVTARNQNSKVTIEQDGKGLQMVEPGADLAEVVKALNALGVTPPDLMSILEALKAAGALRAELEII
jgi:flagellar P-ring protein precursor FlgI